MSSIPPIFRSTVFREGRRPLLVPAPSGKHLERENVPPVNGTDRTGWDFQNCQSCMVVGTLVSKSQRQRREVFIICVGFNFFDNYLALPVDQFLPLWPIC